MVEDDRLARLTPAQRRLYEQKLREKQSVPTDLRRRCEGPGPHALSFPQERFWFLDQLEPGSTEYNVTGAGRVRGPLDRDALARAVDDLVARQASLRTTFPAVQGVPGQRVNAATAADLPVADLRRIPAAQREAELARRLGAFAREPFDLARGPLFRALLVVLADDDHVLAFGMHHAVCDGWSVAILVRDLNALYRARADGRDAALPELAERYADWAAWQRERMTGPELERLLAHWRSALHGAPSSLELPFDHPRRAQSAHTGRTLRWALAPELATGVRALAARERVTPFVLLLASFQAFLCRISGEEDVVVGSSVANRTRREVEGLVGAFVNTLVLRTSCAGDPTFRELVARAQATARAAYAHAELPFEKLVAELAPVREPTRTPLFNVFFDMVVPRPMPAWETLEYAEVPIDHGNALFDLSLSIEDAAGRLHAALEYSTGLFEPETMERLRRLYTHFLGSAIAAPDTRLSRLPLLDDAERARVVEAFNATHLPYDRGEHAHVLFARRAAATPDAVALEDGPERVTYAELDARANRLAHVLIRAGARPEARIAVCLPRSIDAIVALYGVWKSGAAYVPLDVEDPPPRWTDRLADVGAVALVARADVVARVTGFDGARIALDADAAALRAESAPDPDVALTPETLAYVLYTSGSTGKPKGVMIEHGALANHLAWVRQAFDLRADDRFLLRTPFTFDASLWEIVHPLACGATLVVAAQDAGRDPALLLDLCARARISVMQTVPSLLRVWLEEPRFADCGALRHLICAGEALDPDLWRRFETTTRALGLRIALHNLYGPSEATVDATWHTLAPSDATRDLEAVPIGRPISNASAHVLDAGGEPVPVGVVGELWLGGDGLGRGYWGDPELTAQKFVANRFGAGRLYRTGDLARWLDDGDLVYVGRADRQLKLAGVRVEPGEIESELRAHPDVRDAAVVAQRDAHGPRLAAFVVAAEGRTLDAAALRVFLGARLPRHLVPAAIGVLDALPQTASLKTDLRALAATPIAGAAPAAHEPPRAGTETALARLWAELLGVERVGRDDDFFALGGHSLLAARLVARVREAWRVELPLARFFEGPSVAALAAAIDAAKGDSASGVAIPRRGGTVRALSLAQEGLWIAQQLDPRSTLYNICGGLRLRGALDAAALERSLQTIVERHEILRTTFEDTEDGPRARVHAAGVALARADLSTDARGPEAALRAFLEAETRHVFDLRRGPLLRIALARLGAQDHVLVVDVHHAVADGWSLELFAAELARGYAAIFDGREPDATPLPLQYADWAEWQRAQAGGEREVASLAHWRTALAGAPPRTRLPVDHREANDDAIASHAGATYEFALDAELAAALRRHARELRTPLYPLLAAALAATLHGLGADDDVVLGTVVGTRPRTELEELIGPFVNVLPVRVDMAGDPTFDALVERVARTSAAAWQHGDVPLERIASALGAPRAPGREPFVNVSCDLQSFPGSRARFPGLATELVGVDPGTAKVDLSLAFTDDGDSITAQVQYATALFERATVELLWHRFVDVLRAALASPRVSIATLSPRSPGDRVDDEVVIGGRRARTGVVEDVIAAHPGVRAAVVESRAGADGSVLVAHVAFEPGTIVDFAALHARVRARLAPAAIPARWRVADGALDREALARVPFGELVTIEQPPPLAPRDELEARILARFAAALDRRDAGVLDDFFALGGSSLAAIRLVSKLRAELGADLALADFYASATVAGLARAVREGPRRAAAVPDLAREADLGPDFPARIEARWSGPPRRWLLSGATGYLGAFLLRGLLDRGAESVHVLVRARDDAQALERVRANLARYALATGGLERVRVVRGDLGEPELGLDDSQRVRLADEVDAVLHSGAAVNFLADYARLKAPNVLGTRALLSIAARRGLPFHHVSTIGVYAPAQDRSRVQREDDPLPPSAGLEWGYEQTKWVAEQLVAEARARGLGVTIHRPGRISGSARGGVWNLDDFAARMVRGCVSVRAAPDLDAAIDMTPVDWVADAIVHLGTLRPAGRAYHLANPRPASFLALFARLRARGADVRIVPLQEWFARVRAAIAERPDHELAPLLEMLGAQRHDVDAARLVPDLDLPQLDSANVERDVIAAGVACPEIDDALRDRWIDFFVRAGAIELGGS